MIIEATITSNIAVKACSGNRVWVSWHSPFMYTVYRGVSSQGLVTGTVVLSHSILMVWFKYHLLGPKILSPWCSVEIFGM